MAHNYVLISELTTNILLLSHYNKAKYYKTVDLSSQRLAVLSCVLTQRQSFYNEVLITYFPFWGILDAVKACTFADCATVQKSKIPNCLEIKSTK